MQAFVISLLGIVTIFGYLKKIGYLPDAVTFLLEVYSILALVYVVAIGVQNGFRFVRPGYWLLFGAWLLVIFCGALANHVDPGPIVSGLRYYLRWIPIFLLPAVFAFSEKQVRQQLKFMGIIAVLQLPIAASQRLENFRARGSTGDTTQGTLLNSGILSIFLIGVASIVLGLAMRRVIKVWTAIVLFMICVIPTTLNETKATLFLFPITVAVTFLVGAKPGTRLRATVIAATSVAVFLAIFVPIYDSLISTRAYGTKLSDFFTSEGRAAGYMYSGADIGDTANVKRGDAIVVPLRYLSQDPVLMAFGVGVGNASRSQFGRSFWGEHYETLGPFLGMGFGTVVTELGLLGLLVVILLHWNIFSDARSVASRGRRVLPALAMGWCGVVALSAVSYFYKNLIAYDSMTTLFWYFSGLIAAERMRRPALDSRQDDLRNTYTQGGR
ncbi:MAG: hypothetical protein AB7U18_22070 [Dehalococcoidia bacterium]